MKKSAIFLILVTAYFVTAFQTEKQATAKDFEKFLKKSAYTFVPSGKTFVDGKETTVQGFYISKGEVTNFQYKEFLNYLKVNQEWEKLKICQIDSANWSPNKVTNKGMESFYHQHPAYNEFPVVNISHEAAQLYCQFVADAFMKRFQVGVTVRLPEYAEYVRAARGDEPNRVYAWGSNETRNAKGQVLGNFTRIGEECVTRNPETGKLEVNLAGIQTVAGGLDILAPSVSYWPNAFGVYNLSGNAAEMIATKGFAYGGSWNDPGFDVQIEAKKAFTGTDKTVGFRVVFSYVKTGK